MGGALWQAAWDQVLGGWLVVILPSGSLWPSDLEGAQVYYRGGTGLRYITARVGT